MDTFRLGHNDWLRAARLALLEGGREAVRVEPLARFLGVTKGSFYWHFPNRGALLEALLAEWEGELHDAAIAIAGASGTEGIAQLMTFLKPRIAASERGEMPSDAAIFAWAMSDPAVARRVNAAEARRLAFVQERTGDPQLGEYIYLAYVGFLMRRRRAPGAAVFFPTLARISEDLVEALAPRPRAKVKRAKGSSPGAAERAGAPARRSGIRGKPS